FPGAWQYIKRPKFDVQSVWLRKQPVTTTLKLKGESRNAVAEQVATAARKLGMKAFVTEKGTRTFVFTQKGTWNRLGAYAVHVALVHLNRPYDYRGYRFFQARFVPVGQARNITLRVAPEQGGDAEEVTIPRNGATKLKDGTLVEFKEFHANYRVGGDAADAGEGVYTNPAAVLSVTPPGSAPVQAFAFNPTMAESAPFAKRPVAGHTYRLIDFEKVPDMHILSIQKDP